MILFRVWDVRGNKEVENVQGFRVIKKTNNGVDVINYFQVYHGPNTQTTFTKFAPQDVKIRLYILGNYHNADESIGCIMFEGDSLTIDFLSGTEKYWRTGEVNQIGEGQKTIDSNDNLSIP